MKRIDGYLDINDMKKIPKQLEGFFSVGWYTDGIEQYLFKAETGLMAYKELFYSKIIKKIGLQSAEYDLAVLENRKGVITKNYNQNNLSYTLEEIINSYCLENGIIKTPKYNLTEIPEVISWFCKAKKWKYFQGIEHDLYIQFIIQILLGNSDLKSRNMETQYDSKKLLRLSPFYDFGYYGSISIFEKYSGTYLFLDKRYESSCMPPDLAIQNFLQTAQKSQIEIMKNYLEKLKEVNFAKIIEEIEEQIEKSVEEDMKRKLVISVNKSLKDVSYLVKKVS